MVEHLYPLDWLQGNHPLDAALRCGPAALKTLARDPEMARFDIEGALFLDTETTGLSGGAGTVPFLIGAAGFDGDRFFVRQLFMRDFDEEAAVLLHLSEFLEHRTGVVSYNGKSFDLPLLAGRFVFNRLRPLGLGLPHLDLLHAARRLWKHRLPEMSLARVERDLLGVRRVDDVPGALIPPLYVEYLTRNRIDLIEPILEHNRMDLLSLCSILAAAARALGGQAETGAESLGVAGSYQAVRSYDEAIVAFRRAIALEQEPSILRQASRGLARTLSRMGRHEQARAEWGRLADGWEDLEALEALAKQAEHRLKDFELALQYVDRALIRLNGPLLRSVRRHEVQRQAFRKRRDRLQRRRDRSRS